MPISSKDPLNVLTVIDRLEVGPVRLERKRLKMPYRIFCGKRRDSVDLIYRYEEDVFSTASIPSLNLSSMIGAQVALNYGLFCKEIVFYGPFDRNDRHLIDAMAENTAREIFVKKFLEPNPFLQGVAADLPAVKKKSYLRAKIVFADNEVSFDKNISDYNWKSDNPAYAVLSSGGKDSLLSFGLLNELGEQVDPIYINESGRHWYTALNAFRYFKANVPRTARVWTNADRLFNRMLHYLPFIRQDFARFRADEYPIRLWTVAVFLFGALPLLRKRGLNRLIIGNEYDTTRRMYHKGILHYDGLYDQSRYFDNAISSYFRLKGWGLRQFSIIRQLSELMIEKILVERYPHLQKQQVSCHATHIERGRVIPCGSCEKCRRIVGMLAALGADPERCGYNRSDIKKILGELAGTTLRQDADTAGQTLFLLAQKGMIPPVKMSKTKPHSQIMKLMIDKDKSPVGEVPDDLRNRLFAIYLKHSNGTAERRGRVWADFSLKRY